MLNVIEYQGQRVLTTAQLATAFATTHNTIKNVFAHAKQQFQSDRHFFLLEGTPLRAFKATPAAAAALPKSVSCLYLWTEQGAALLANLLAKPHAFDELKRVYFNTEARHDADNVARQLGFVEAGKFSTRGERFCRPFASTVTTSMNPFKGRSFQSRRLSLTLALLIFIMSTERRCYYEHQ